jgi:FkbM family methyltransferase
MFLPTGWRGISKLIFTFREQYEPELTCLHRLLSKGMNFVDVGACLGIYSAVAGKLVGESGRVLAFEPSAQSFATLQRNIAMNRLTNVRPFPLALSDKQARAHLYHEDDPGRNSLGACLRPNRGFEEVRTEPLDSVLEANLVGSVDVIKMDVEGAEELVLRGARAILTRSHPVVIFEVNPDAAKGMGLSADGAWKFLEPLGYEFYRMDETGNPSRIKSPPAGGNVLAVHSAQQGSCAFAN